MLCEICNKNEATIQLINQNSDEIKEFIMICDTCAVEMMRSSLEEEDIDLNDMINKLNNYILDDEFLEVNNDICKRCGTKYIDFDENRVLGCEKCYESFRENIKDIMHLKGYGNHVGKRPKGLEKYYKGKEVFLLEEELKINILNEEYEKAILTKEKIHHLKKNMEDSKNDSMD